MSSWDRELDSRYEIEPFADSDLTDQQVINLWMAEDALPLEVATERVGEVALVGRLTGGGALAGVCTTYLAHNEHLGMSLWHYRTFVAAADRESDLGRHLLYRTIDHLGERFASGEDTSAPGMIMEIENELIKKHRNEAVWPSTGFTFVGENARGDHIRVLYFDGAHVPLPGAPGRYA